MKPISFPVKASESIALSDPNFCFMIGHLVKWEYIALLPFKVGSKKKRKSFCFMDKLIDCRNLVSTLRKTIGELYDVSLKYGNIDR